MEESSNELSPEAIESLLGRGGTGVLALARDDAPYAIPVSYGFDPAAGRFYVRLGTTEHGEKRAFLDGPRQARLVVYADVDGEWQSVVATGDLAVVDEADVDRAMVQTLRQAALPLSGMFDPTAGSVTFEMYALDARTLTGRRARPERL